MKKIIAMAIAAICLVSASFALDLEFGARAILGRNLDDGTFKENATKAKEEQTFDFGGGAYANFALFGGLGIQAEANYIKSSIDFKAKDPDTNKYEQVAYELHTLDLAPMVWLNLDLWRLTIGFGAGPNFSIPVATVSDIKNAQKQDFTVGLIAGADVKFYFTKHLGVVLSGRYITDWTKKNITLEGYGQTVDTGIPEYTFNRKTFYGGLGLEFKLL
ncbi:MAG: outer membrane beta-barrel protein [Treponema sp.]|nr:outer membrane beta-barrel protein [Treponema sp.]